MEKLRVITPALLDLLRVLVDEPGYAYGYELASYAGRPAGTLYVLLSKLERVGWVKSYRESLNKQFPGRPTRRFYKLTPDGRAAARELLMERGWLVA